MSLRELEQRQAVELAASRNDWYVSAPGPAGLHGPLSERQARQMVSDVLEAGRKPLLLRVVEDYGKGPTRAPASTRRSWRWPWTCPGVVTARAARSVPS